MLKERVDIVEQMKVIRREAWIVYVNNGWGDLRAANLARSIYKHCVEVIGKEENDKVRGPYERT